MAVKIKLSAFIFTVFIIHCTLILGLASTYLQILNISGGMLHKIYCQVNEILCRDLSADLTPSHDSAELEDMSITHLLKVACG